MLLKQLPLSLTCGESIWLYCLEKSLGEFVQGPEAILWMNHQRLVGRFGEGEESRRVVVTAEAALLR